MKPGQAGTACKIGQFALIFHEQRRGPNRLGPFCLLLSVAPSGELEPLPRLRAHLKTKATTAPLAVAVKRPRPIVSFVGPSILPSLILDLVVAHDDLSITWRGLVVARALASVGVALLRRGGRAGVAVAAALRCAVAHVSLAGGLGLLALAAGPLGPAALVVLRDDDVGDAAVLRVADPLVVAVVGLGELGDNVPGVEEAREEAEDAQEDVDDRVGAANSTLDPDCGWVS